MTNSIWKFELAGGTHQEILMPKGAEILYVADQGSSMCMWAKVDTDAPEEARLFMVFGTGWEIPEDGIKYLGTILSGPFVWHICEAVNTPTLPLDQRPGVDGAESTEGSNP